MESNGKDCHTAIQALVTRCADNEGWKVGNICQSSCYFAGRGYDGDVCCPGDTYYPTASPTEVPSVSGSPSLEPTKSPSLQPTVAVTSTASPSSTVNGSSIATSPAPTAANGSNDGTGRDSADVQPSASPTTMEIPANGTNTNSSIGADDTAPGEEASATGNGADEKRACNTPYGIKQPGELYFTSDGCNYCICGDDGIPACTALICPGTPSFSMSTVSSSSTASSSPSASQSVPETAPPSASMMPTTTPSTASPTGIVCPSDVLECGNNITIKRDPNDGCNFGPTSTCPPTTMPPGTSYACPTNFTGLHPVDMCLAFIWCRDGQYVAGPSICSSGTGIFFDSSTQSCKDADEVTCEVGFRRRNRYLRKVLVMVERRGEASKATEPTSTRRPNRIIIIYLFHISSR